ncbi:MAG: penicillin-binding transpeptidase domain-containing protein [Phycisphaerales bacterium JB058]
MRLSHLIQSQGARRLILVVLLIALGLSILAAQASRLSILKGDELLAEAQQRLVRLSWSPTVRGQILDRKGRVLAHNRPSFDIAVNYPVISGEWVEREAAARARRDRGKDWAKLSREQRTQLIEEAKPKYRAAVDRMWNVLAAETGHSRAEIDLKRMQVREQVDAMAGYLRGKRAASELRKLAQSLGITPEELETRLDVLDRPDLRSQEERLRHVLAEEITVEVSDRIDKNADIRFREESTPRVIVPEVSDEVGFRLRRLARQSDPDDETIPYLPGLAVMDSGRRDYPLDELDVEIDRSLFPKPLASDEITRVHVSGVASHILGSVRRRVYLEDGQARKEELQSSEELAQRSVLITPTGSEDRGRYFPGDMVGSRGIERNLESTLRGLRGLRIERVDQDDAIDAPMTFGENVKLTIDIMLQARIQALLDPNLGLARVQPWHNNRERLDPDDPESPLVMNVGDSLDGAAVVIDVDTGEILAMVSTPTSLGTFADPEERIRNQLIRRPSTNKAVSMPLPPGSIAKALVLCGAHKAGLVDVDEHISCTGHFYPHEPEMLRCWIYKQFGTTHDAQFGHTPGGAEAIKGSCNIYFYTLGQRLGAKGIVDFYRSIGVGESLDLPLDNTLAGWLGFNNNPDGVGDSDAILMGIGQGPVAWTPVHAADAFATLARGGVRIKPTIIAGDMPEPIDLGFDPAIVDEALHGLDMVVNDRDGTANHVTLASGETFDIFDVPGVKVWGKTGTATTTAIVYKGEVLRRGDHSWFVLLCGRDRPKYAIAVVAEYGGSGGRVSGPIANQIVHALVQEGYL